ncbi:MAG: tetratricopeptide repeat protein, partial [Planctomycetales bacterium]|nr:tetratricopeptide repeat protein [Planctomycetales bacterium]
PEACFDKARGLMDNIKDNPARQERLKSRLIAGYASIAERRGDWAQAIKLLTYLAGREKDSTGYFQRLGLAYYRQGNEDAAYASYQKAQAKNKDMADARVMLAQLLRADGKPDNAMRYIDEAMRASNANQQTRIGVGLLLTLSDKLDKAGPYVEAAREAFPSSPDLQILSGVIARYQRDYKKALERFEAAQRLDPNNFTASNLVALAQVNSSDPDEKNKGLALAQENLRRNPQNRDAHIALGWIYYQFGRMEEAQKLIDPALRGAANLSPDSSYFVAKILYDQQRFDNAQQLLEQALNSPNLFIYREEAKALMGNLDIERLRQSVNPK